MLVPASYLRHEWSKYIFSIFSKPSSSSTPLHAKSWLIGKESDAGRDWGQEKGTTEDEMAGWHHWLERESKWTPGVGDGQGGLVCCDSWVCKESDTTERLNWTELRGILLSEHKCAPEILNLKKSGLSQKNISSKPTEREALSCHHLGFGPFHL